MKFESLQDIEGLKKLMEKNVKGHPEFYRRRMRLLDKFFAKNPEPVDICLILYGALSDAHHLAYHLEGNNLICYRPTASHRRLIYENFLYGETHTDKTLLLFDQDIVTGNAMRETYDFFINLGYDRSKIFGYLDEGCTWRKHGTSELMHIDDLLKK